MYPLYVSVESLQEKPSVSCFRMSMDPATISIPGIGCMTRKFLSYRVSRDQFSTMLVAVDLSGSDNHQLDLDRLHH